MTSLTDGIAFMIGGLSILPALKSTCVCACARRCKVVRMLFIFLSPAKIYCCKLKTTLVIATGQMRWNFLKLLPRVQPSALPYFLLKKYYLQRLDTCRP